MKNLLIALLIVLSRIIPVSAGQVSINASDQVMIGGYIVNDIGSDSTMLTGTNHNVACAIAVKQYVDSSFRNKSPKIYTASGLQAAQEKRWYGIITPTTGTGQSVDISSAGFSGINTVQLTPFLNTTTVTSIPIISGKTYTNTAVTFNLVTSNSGIIGLLVGLVAITTLTGITVQVEVNGY